jgi:hypothetical protein
MQLHLQNNHPDLGVRPTIEAASWRLASELVRRHPHLRIHQGVQDNGLLDDWLTVHPATEEPGGHFNYWVRLNRDGTVQGPFGAADPIEWAEYLTGDPVFVLDRVSEMLNLPVPAHLPPSTSLTLTYRVLAVWATTRAFAPIAPHSLIRYYGFDTSDTKCPELPYDLPEILTDTNLSIDADEDYWRCWIVGDDAPYVLVAEESASVWGPKTGDEPVMIEQVYRANGRRIVPTAWDVATRVGLDLS